MKYFYTLCILVLCLSCGNEKELKLAEIKHSKITEILDVSPAYVFYNAKAEGNIELNKQNLISTTNWLVNVDRRLTLQQAIPVVINLQTKKKDASHKKEGVKNYYTGFNAEAKHLCFIDFTQVIYHLTDTAEDFVNTSDDNSEILSITSEGVLWRNKTSNIETLVAQLDALTNERHTIVLNFSNQLAFQEYMHIKDVLLSITNPAVLIHTNEFIFQS